VVATSGCTLQASQTAVTDDDNSDSDNCISTSSAKHDSVNSSSSVCNSSTSHTQSADVQQGEVENSATAATPTVDTSSDADRSDVSNTGGVDNEKRAAATEVSTDAYLHTTFCFQQCMS
jgi:hypothetical protein